MDFDREKFYAEYKKHRAPFEYLMSYYGAYKKNRVTLENLIFELMIAAEFYTPEQIVSALDQDTRMKLRQWVEKSPERDNMILSSASLDVIRVEDIRKMKTYFKEHPEG
jgi:hypothetical protein